VGLGVQLGKGMPQRKRNIFMIIRRVNGIIKIMREITRAIIKENEMIGSK